MPTKVMRQLAMLTRENMRNAIDAPQTIAEGEALYRAGAYAEAESIFAAIAARDPENPQPHRLLGLCCLRTGKTGEGLASLARAFRLAPDDAYVRLHYGIGLHAAGRDAEAAELFASCIERLPADPAPSLNLAAARLGLQDPAGALEAATRAVRVAPTMPQALYTLGLAQMAMQQPRAAAAAFMAAVQRAPAFADAWVNLGLAHYAMDDPGAAEQAMRHALAAAPGHPAATGNLAVFLRLRGGSREAEAMLRALLNRRPDSVEARLNLAAWLLHEEKPGEALQLLAGTPPREQRARRHWDEHRSLALIQLGQQAEARAVLDALGEPADGPTLTLLWRRILLARAERNEAAARSAAEAMEQRLEHPRELLEHRIMGHFNLAKFWSAAAADRAFSFWERGHALLRRIQPFSRADERAFTDASAQHLDRGRLHDGPRARNADPAPVFVVGMPRSGTTLMEQILAAHPSVHGAGERSALGEMFAAFGGGGPDAARVQRIAALDAATLDAAAGRYLGELRALAPGAQRIVDKMPGNYRLLGLVALLFPGARIIHCQRDPRDIGLSIFTFRFFGYHPYAHDLGDLGWYIAEQDRIMAHWRSALPNLILPVQLSDWVTDFDATLRRVLEFLDLPYDSACAKFHEVEREVHTVSRAQVREPVHGRGLGRWRSYANRLAPLIEALEEGGVSLRN
jgi:Flp pilus assembly protein TadD